MSCAPARRASIAALVAALSCASNPALADQAINLPEIGDPSGTLMTSRQERELGEAFFRNLHSQVEINQDSEITEYIQSLGQQLGANSDNVEQSFHFFIVNDPVINAFAGPGGYIGVNSGLFLTTESESELASVLAHEIAHVTQRHLYQTFQAAGKLSLPMAAAMLGAVLLGMKSPELAQAALIATQAGSMQYQINFTRDNEQEADRVGILTLSRAHFDPRSMPVFFERMQQSTRFAGRDLPEFLRTHPVTVSRIADTRGRAEQFPYRQYPDSITYQIIKAKLRAETTRNPAEAIDYFKAVMNQGTPLQKDISRYGYALALMRVGKPEQSEEILRKLVQRYADQSHFYSALAEVEQARGDYPKALSWLETALQRFPSNRTLAMDYAQALLKAGKPEQARKQLEGYARHNAANPDIFGLLAQTYSKLGKDAESHRFLAEYYYATGQTKAAILQLGIAHKMAGSNFYLNSVIDDRLRDLLEEEKERKKR
jgi:predicted Zn-dependent protease